MDTDCYHLNLNSLKCENMEAANFSLENNEIDIYYDIAENENYNNWSYPLIEPKERRGQLISSGFKTR